MIPWLRGDATFPPVSKALRSPNGLLCAGGDLSPERIVEAYSRGIFPWFSEGDPILWWSPDPRMVLFPEELKVSRSLRKTLAHGDYEVRVDCAFREVMRECAAPRDGHGGTWIVPEMIDAYTELHARGFAHSVESWREGELAGGLYGVALGKVFFGESMFARADDASKIAFVTLLRQLDRWGFSLIDCQQKTEHLLRFGSIMWRRARFQAALAVGVKAAARPGPWRLDSDLGEGAPA